MNPARQSDLPTAGRGRYVLVTPAKNEEATIRVTIDSVRNQVLQPVEWVIVNDGSTDRTEQIVNAAALSCPWIRLIQLPARPDRNFAAVVRATEVGIGALATGDFDYLGLLDADVRFDPEYFQQVIAAFDSAPMLGLAGGMVIDLGRRRDRPPSNRQDVPGAVQFFRRDCFAALGGLIAIPEGGWDGLTCAQARMAGFETRLLTHLVVDHLKPRNIAEGGWYRRTSQLGARDYALGYHPLFEISKCLGRLPEPPALVGSLARLLGYCGAAMRRRERRIPAKLLAFVRREQLTRLRRVLRGSPGGPARPGRSGR